MADSNLEDCGVRNPGEVAASPALGHGEYIGCEGVVNNPLSISPRAALASWDVGPGISDAVPVCSVAACLSKSILTTWKDYFQ